MSRYENHNLEDRELPFIYRERQAKSIKLMPSSANWHENIEVIQIVSGSGAVYNNGHVLPVSEGDVIVINANHLHSLFTDGEPLVHRYLIVDREFCVDNGVDTSLLSFDTRISGDEIRGLMEELNKIYFMPDIQCRILKIRSLVLQILVLLCERHSSPLRESLLTDRSLSYVKQAITYIRASYDKDFSLDDVAEFVGVNKCYLSREFHKYTGYPFVAYVNRTRCKMACQLLLNEKLSVSEVGRRCGFPNRSYFAKCFKRYIGALPAEYRANILESR